jgi:AraC-like DNA-binding protein
MDICQEFLPQAALRPFVESVWHTAPIANSRFQIVPDGSVDVCFVLSPSAPRTLLFGTTTRTSEYTMEVGVPYLGVHFRPGKASFFVRDKISELTDASVPIPNFLGLSAERIVSAGSSAAWRSQLESALLLALGRGTPKDFRAVHHAINLIDSHYGDIRVRDVASSCNLSERQLERLFVEQVGVTPKLYARIRRFRAVLNVFADPTSDQKPRLADLAAEYGYVDQSHLMRDFAGFSHPLPTAM